LLNYGVKGLQAFFDSSYNKPSTMSRTIMPGEDYIFSTAFLSHNLDHGRVRSELILDENALQYKVNIEPYGSTFIPCGEILFPK